MPPAPPILTSDLDQLVADCPEWLDLQILPNELRCSKTLTTGQSFSWTAVVDDTASTASTAPSSTTSSSSSSPAPSAWGSLSATNWVGSIGSALYQIRETPTSTFVRQLHPAPAPSSSPPSPSPLIALFSKYFQLSVPLAPLYASWAASSPSLFPSSLLETLPGVRVLAQPPVETLIAFLTSSNNNIPRINSLLATLRRRCGELLVTTEGGHEFRSFPTLQSLSALTDEDWRAMGFG